MFLACGAPGQGKTYLVRNWLLPTLLNSPAEIWQLAPDEGFGVVLIHDPERPRTGRQYPGQRFADVAEFRRAQNRELLCCFERPDYREMLQLALDLAEGRVWNISVFDEMAKVFPSEGGKLRDPYKKICEEGRHFGAIVVGCALRLGDIHLDARKAIQGLWISDLSDDGDRATIGRIIRRPKLLDTLHLNPREFLEWKREDGRLLLISIVNYRRVVLREL